MTTNTACGAPRPRVSSRRGNQYTVRAPRPGKLSAAGLTAARLRATVAGEAACPATRSASTSAARSPTSSSTTTTRGRQSSRKVLTTHDDPARAVAAGVGGAARRGRVDPAARHPRRARHHAVHQRPHRAQGRADRAPHDGRFRRHARDRARAQVRALRPQHREARAARPARSAPRGARAHRRPTAACGSRSTSDALAARRRASSRRGVASIAIVFLHAYANPRHEADGARVIAARHPGHRGDHLARGGAGDPRVRARLDHRRQRLHQAAGPALPRR